MYIRMYVRMYVCVCVCVCVNVPMYVYECMFESAKSCVEWAHVIPTILLDSQTCPAALPPAAVLDLFLLHGM